MSSTGFSFGGGLTGSQTQAGFSFGAAPSKATTVGGFASTNTTTGNTTKTGFGSNVPVGGPGFTFAKTTASTSTTSTFNLAGFGSAATSQPGSALGTKTTASLTLGAPASTTSTGFNLGPYAPSASTSVSSSGTGIFASTGVASTVNRGLGGVDPKTTSSGGSSGGGTGKGSDSKAVKETKVPDQISTTVEDFKKYVKEQKSVRENIARMPSKPMFKVQEEVASLKQLLALVSNGLQRNALTIDKLKKESAQELKYAEMAQRTKDTPPGLQYENTAPTEYFRGLVEEFEYHMAMYRQQIEDTENHLASFNQSSTLSPQELSMLLNKLHESFVALAAQLQAVHESVQSQKEQYLNYRKVFHSDTTDIFERRKKAHEKTGSSCTVTTVGPDPFSGMSNAAAVAMASALNRTQQPQAAGQPSLGLGQQLGGFGGTAVTQSSLFGGTGASGGLFAGQANQQPSGGLFGSKPLGSTGTGFGTALGSTATTSQSTGFFGAQTATVKPLGFGNTSLQQPQNIGFGTPQTNTGFQLQSPPTGNKRGKKA